jgi:hypothetical protein
MQRNEFDSYQRQIYLDELEDCFSVEEWKESQSGNFYRHLDNDVLVTACLCRDERWRGICDDQITNESFSSAEEAMNAIDKDHVTFVPFKCSDSGWLKAKKGGYHRQVRGLTYTIKQSRSGRWYVMVGDALLKGHWFNSIEAAKEYVAILIARGH